MDDCAAFDQLADRHESRRGTGLPTVSMLVGPVALGRRHWCRWAASRARPAVAVVGGDVARWHREWLRALVNNRDLCGDAETYLAKELTEPLETTRRLLCGCTRHELRLLFDRAHLDAAGRGPGRVCRWLLLCRVDGRLPTTDELVGTLVTDAVSPADYAEAFAQVLGLLADQSCPALLVVPDTMVELHDPHEVTDAQIARFQTSAQQTADLVTRLPQLTVAIAANEPLWNAYVARAPECFSKAVIRQHVIDVRGSSVEQLRRQVAKRVGRRVAELEVVLPEVVRIGASPALVESLVAASIIDAWGPSLASNAGSTAIMPEVGGGPPGDEADAWKSAQEWFLFQLLEHTPDLAGQFQLNADPGFLFGNQPAAVDLLCCGLKIAIEIDGYYHFTSPDRYRRDRRKDIELQRHGFLVLRFLAEDIVPEMVEILESIRRIVRFRELHFRS